MADIFTPIVKTRDVNTGIDGTPVVLDYVSSVARGDITGAQVFYGYGEKTTTGADSGVLWPNGAFVFPSSAGVQMAIVSTSANDAAAGTGARTIEIHYLDANLVSQVETVTMNGVTPVNTVATNIRFIQCMHVITVGSGGSAAGNISASNGANTHSYIATGALRCSSSVRMVPAGKRLLINALFGGSLSGSGNKKSVIRLATPSFDTHDFTASGLFMPLAALAYQDNSSGISIQCPLSFTEGESVGFTFETDGACTVVGSWFGWLEDV